MRSKSAFEKIVSLASALSLLLVFSACGGSKAVKSDTAAPAESPAASSAAVSKEAPLGKRYDKVVFQKFESDPQIETDYPGAVAECEKSALEAVTARKIFSSAVRETAGEKYPGALLVKTKVTSLRIVSSAARMWGGAFAGSSDMSLQMKLIDASDGSVVREKELSTSNNPWAAAWTFGGSDKSLPTDLGMMVAEYLGSIQPQKDKVPDSVPVATAPATPEKKTAESDAPKPAGAVSVQAQPVPAPSPSAPAAAQAPSTLTVTKTASIRSQPSTKGKVLATLKKGTKVENLGKSGNWFNVKLSTGVTGWVLNSLVTGGK